MQVSNTLSTDGGSGLSLDLATGDLGLDLGGLPDLGLNPDLGLDIAPTLPDFSSADLGGFPATDILSDLPTLPDLSTLDPVAQGDALHAYDAATGSRAATDSLASGAPADPVDTGLGGDVQGPDIVVTADPVLTHLVSPEIMSESTFELFARDDAALRAERDAFSERTGLDYAILPQERQMAAEYIYMGEFAGLREYAPANFYAGDRPEPGGLEDLAGKLWAAPVTVPAAIAGAANVGLGALAGNENAGIQFGDNAIQFVGGAFGQGGTLGWGGEGAVTLGNTQLYAGNVTPDTPTNGYDGGTVVRTGDHEEGHTYQYQRDGVLFFPQYLPQGVQNPANPYEQAADAGARGGSPYP